MAIIPDNQKIITFSSGIDTREKRSALINSREETYTIEDLKETVGGGGGAIPVETVYPTTDATKVGQKFIYKGNEWKYHSQAELVDLGWDSAVSEGFPAPVNKRTNLNVLLSANEPVQAGKFLPDSSGYDFRNFSSSSVLDFIGVGQFVCLLKQFVENNVSTITEFKNANLLINLEDQGTNVAFKAFAPFTITVSDAVINDFFTQLPTTTKTATLDIAAYSGAATCDPTIATAKGYTVITS